MRLYLDANAVIHGVEGPQGLKAQVLGWVDRAEAAPGGTAITSRLTVLECRVRPLRNADTATLARFDTVFSASNLLLVDVTPSVIDLATEIRAHHGVRVPDAIHLATAVLARADFFLTGDVRLGKFDRIPVTILNAEP